MFVEVTPRSVGATPCVQGRLAPIALCCLYTRKQAKVARADLRSSPMPDVTASKQTLRGPLLVARRVELVPDADAAAPRSTERSKRAMLEMTVLKGICSTKQILQQPNLKTRGRPP